MPQELICLLESIELSPVTVEQIKVGLIMISVIPGLQIHTIGLAKFDLTLNFILTTQGCWSSVSKTTFTLG